MRTRLLYGYGSTQRKSQRHLHTYKYANPPTHEALSYHKHSVYGKCSCFTLKGEQKNDFFTLEAIGAGVKQAESNQQMYF